MNHPNFRWSFGVDELRQVRGDRLLEIFNGHPTVHNDGGGGTPGMVEVWDMLLAEGKRIYGIAVDDAHHFQGEFGPDRANPGRGWVSVRADALDGATLMEAMEAGHFYASTGVELDDVEVEAGRITVTIAVRPRLPVHDDVLRNGRPSAPQHDGEPRRIRPRRARPGVGPGGRCAVCSRRGSKLPRRRRLGSARLPHPAP